MQTYELDALLGDARDDLLTLRGRDGYDDLLATMDSIGERYPDDEEAAQNAASAALMLALGDEALESLSETWITARRAERAAMEALTGAIHWESQRGAGPSELARRSGVTRPTIDRALSPQA